MAGGFLEIPQFPQQMGIAQAVAQCREAVIRRPVVVHGHALE